MMQDCNQQQALIPSYLDGELSEALAAPLRQHLLACQECRNAAQGERSLKAWFPEDEQLPVPVGFAARVARRAFDGDTGELEAPLPASEPAPILRFVLRATAVAAAVLLVLSVVLRSTDLPNTDRVQADNALQPLDEVLRELDHVNGKADSPAAVQPAHSDE